MKFHLDFYTQYSQFYVYDKDSPGETDSINFWTNEAFNDRLAIEDGILGIGTECYGPVKAEVEILKSENLMVDFSDFDHIVEAGINIKSGVIQILNCPDWSVQVELDIPPKNYRVRVYSSNLISVEGDEGDDFYRIEIWPDDRTEVNVLKRYQG